jgi:ankyrin repeat protein
MKDLVKAGIDVNLRSKDGQTALIVAVGAGEEKMAEALLKAGADPDISDSLGASARKYAVLFHRSSMLALFETYAPEKAIPPKAE